MLYYSVTSVLVGRVTLHLRSAVYGPPNLSERTVEGIPLADFSKRKNMPNFHRAVQRDPYESTFEMSTQAESSFGRELYA